MLSWLENPPFCPAQRCQCCLLDPLDANAPPQRLLSHGRVWPFCTEAGPGKMAEGGMLAMPRNLRWCLQSPSHQDRSWGCPSLGVSDVAPSSPRATTSAAAAARVAP